MGTVVSVPILHPGHLPWASLVYIRVLPESARVVAPIDGGPSKVDPIGFVHVYDPKFGKKKMGLLESFCALTIEHDPLDTAVRACAMFVGLTPPRDRVYCMARELGGLPTAHWKYLFCVDLYQGEANKIQKDYRSAEGHIPLSMSSQEQESLIEEGAFLERHRIRLEWVCLLPSSKFAIAV